MNQIKRKKTESGFGYPAEADNLDVFGHLEELRKRILISLAFLAAFSVLAFFNGNSIFRIVTIPAKGVIHQFIFITPSEVFVAYVKIALLFGFFFSFPFLLHQAWIFVSPAVSKVQRKNIILWFLLSVVFLAMGILFSFYVALPAALRFLISFGEGIAVASITIQKYVSFFTAFMLIGGIMFEIPIIIGILTDLGIIKPSVLKEKRAYAVIFILVIAAIVTPTQDIVNLLIFSIPMIFLYELGIIISSILYRTKKED